MKIFAFDVETTGVDCRKHSIHQISWWLFVDGKIVDKQSLNVRPHPKAVIEDEALAIAGVTREQIEAYAMGQEDLYATLMVVLNKYCDKFNKQDKIFLAGYNNASFDNDFLRKLFEINADNYFGSWFWSNSLDAMVLATPYLAFDRPTMPDFKLMTVAKYCGIAVDEQRLHDAEYDIYLTVEILKTVTQGLF